MSTKFDARYDALVISKWKVYTEPYETGLQVLLQDVIQRWTEATNVTSAGVYFARRFHYRPITVDAEVYYHLILLHVHP
jgi:hypothetical protein